ncbi:hypothetical protein SBA4_5520012 [Candidatus Sulfopaludibacter sp. SbA4]|nr:hypothetical protein SBA4_5520012 [Candidatus Sulfopaludibacter sp. SbA4]
MLNRSREVGTRRPLPDGRGSVTVCKHAIPVTEPRPLGSGFPRLSREFPGTVKHPTIRHASRPGAPAPRPYNIGMLLPRFCAALLLAAPALAIDLKSAVIVAPATLRIVR